MPQARRRHLAPPRNHSASTMWHSCFYSTHGETPALWIPNTATMNWCLLVASLVVHCPSLSHVIAGFSQFARIRELCVAFSPHLATAAEHDAFEVARVNGSGRRVNPMFTVMNGYTAMLTEQAREKRAKTAISRISQEFVVQMPDPPEQLRCVACSTFLFDLLFLRVPFLGSVLHLRNHRITDLASSGLDQFRAVRVLDLSSNKLTNLPWRFFAMFPELVELNLNNNRIHTVELDAVARNVQVCPKLRSLELCNNAIKHLDDIFKIAR